MKKTVGRVIGPLGILLILFALFARVFLTGEFNTVVWLQLGLGVAGLVFWLLSAFDDARNMATGRGTVFVVVSVVAGALVLGTLGALNYAAVKKGKEWDLTAGGIHTLAGQTTAALQAIPADAKVHVTAFYQPLVDREHGPLEELLRRYKTAGGENFTYEFVDGAKNPQAAKAMGVTAQGPRIVLKSASGKESRAKEPTEEALTNALMELQRGVERKVYFLTAHGEKPSGNGADTGQGLKLWVDGLASEGLRAEELNLLARKDVPDDALAVVVAGPQSPLADGERDALKRYADKGGRLLIMVDPGSNAGLEPLLAGWGLELGRGFAIDPESQEPLWAFSQEFAQHPLSTPRMSVFGALAFVFPEARAVRKASTPVDGYEVTELFKTGTSAWGETSPLPADGRVVRDDVDEPGPISLAVAVTKKLEGESELRVVVVGDSDWASNQFIRQGGNRDLALNALQWLGGSEQKVTIRPRLREKSTLAVLSNEQRQLLSVGSLNLLPMLLIACGLSVWSVRRSR